VNTNFNPFVRYIAKSAYIIADKTIVANDCRLIYILSGNGSFESGGKVYPLSPGALIYYPCGMPYKFSLCKENKLLIYTVNFDFSHSYSNIAPMGPEEYKGCLPSNILYTQYETKSKLFESIIYLPASIWCEDALKRICDEGLLKKEGYEALQSAVMKIILINIFRNIQDTHNNSVCKQIKAILSEKIDLNNKQIAKMLNYHPFYLNEIFKKEEGTTLHQYILKQRLIKAHELITSTQLTIEEISSICGFSSQSHLSYTFKKNFGVTPTQIRKFL
jgi:AraC-like DNA-binding protein